MAEAKKKFALAADRIKRLARNRGGCIATDMITVEGRKVGFMCRATPSNNMDSGWQFMSGLESQAYMDNAANHGVYDVNTIANYDPDILPYLDAPIGSAFERQDESGGFLQVEGETWEPETKPASPAKKWPPPGFPLVEGDYALTSTWSIHLPERFARRQEERSLVLWRPGLTMWLSAWNNDRAESKAGRLAWIKKSAAASRFDERESHANNTTHYNYRLRDQNADGPVDSINAVVIIDKGHLQIAIYFDAPADEITARQLLDSVTVRQQG